MDFDDVQLSVPASWTVLAGGEQACDTAQTGVLILGRGSWCPPGSGEEAAPHTTIVTLRPSRTPLLGKQAPTLVVNGLSVYAPDISPVYFIPALGAELTFSRPLQPGILHSITYSPRAVALASTASVLPTVPTGWRSISFRGVRFAVPPSWSVHRAAHAPACSSDTALSHAGVTLASGPELAVPCPSPLSAPRPQVTGVEVDGFSSGQVVGTSDRPSCVFPKQLHDLQACVEAQPALGELIVQLAAAGMRPVTVKIGLFGDGRTGRDILYSFRRS